MENNGNPFRQVVNFYRDKDYFTQLYKLAVPIALQNLLTASMSMVGNVMVGQLGDASIAAVGRADSVMGCDIRRKLG